MAAACAQALPPVWPPGWPAAVAHAPVRASLAALSSSSPAAAGAAAEAAAGSKRRLWRPGRRLRGVRSRGAAGAARGRRGAASRGFRRSLWCMLVLMEKKCNRLLLVTMCVRMCVMYGGRHRVIHDEPYTSVCVASCDVWFKRILLAPLPLELGPAVALCDCRCGSPLKADNTLTLKRIPFCKPYRGLR